MHGFLDPSEPFSAGSSACVLCWLMPRILAQLCPLFIHAGSTCFMTHESQQVWSSANRPICRLDGRTPCRKLARAPVHPHTDCCEASSSAQVEWASLPAGTLPSEQMGPGRGRQQSTHVSSGYMHIYRLCLPFTGDEFLNRKAKFTK